MAVLIGPLLMGITALPALRGVPLLNSIVFVCGGQLRAHNENRACKLEAVRADPCY